MTERTDSDLLPCPFCGSQNVRLLPPTCTEGTPYDQADRAFPNICCGECFASVPGKNWDHQGDSAITAWNRRAAAAMAEGGGE